MCLDYELVLILCSELMGERLGFRVYLQSGARGLGE